MDKHLFKQSKHGHWNIKCGNIEYFHRFALSIPLGTVSLAGVSVSGVATVLTEKYQKKLIKVKKLIDILTSAISVFEMIVSKASNNGKIDK